MFSVLFLFVFIQILGACYAWNSILNGYYFHNIEIVEFINLPMLGVAMAAYNAVVVSNWAESNVQFLLVDSLLCISK